jgi:hypothetical protein
MAAIMVAADSAAVEGDLYLVVELLVELLLQ